MKQSILLVFISLTFFGCKKDKLEGDKSIFIGKWKWVYTEKVHRPLCDDPPMTTVLTPTSEGKEFSIEFFKKGCVTFYENGKKIEKYRTVFTESGFRNDNNPNYIGYFSFGFYLDNNNDNVFFGFVKSDTLIELGFFPFKEDGLDCTSYTNYFVKE